MKYATLALMGIGLAIVSSIATGQAPAPKGEPEMKTVEQKFSYVFGLDLARRMKAQSVELDPEILAKGIKDGLADKSAFTDQQILEIQQAFQKLLMAKQDAEAAAKVGPAGEKNLKDGQAFLAANKAKPGVTVLPSGLQYKVLKSGPPGGKSPKLTDSVLANYKGTLTNGTEFDSSYKRGEPSEFPVGGVIKGWTEILQKMKVGDKWEVYIPAELAYGPRQMGPIIAPNSVLIFEMELVEIK